MDEIMKLSEEDFEEYREMFQDVLALRGDLRLFYTTDKELSDAASLLAKVVTKVASLADMTNELELERE